MIISGIYKKLSGTGATEASNRSGLETVTISNEFSGGRQRRRRIRK
jgi:hypothetical protein